MRQKFAKVGRQRRAVLREIVKKPRVVMLGAMLFLLLAGAASTQQKTEEIPDAPSTAQPVPPPALPTAQPPAGQDSRTDSSSADEPASPPKEPVPTVNEPPRSVPDDADTKTAPPPMPPVKTVPEGSVASDTDNTRDELYRLPPVTVSYVVVPVTVKDADGRLVPGLLPKDFTVLENGQN